MLINKNSGEPVYMQIINQYKRQIASGALKTDDKLPSVRKLSYDLGINPNTLQKAYTHLEQTGICYSLAGKGRFVSEDAYKIITGNLDEHFDALHKAVENLAMCNLSLDEILKKVKESYKKANDSIKKGSV